MTRIRKNFIRGIGVIRGQIASLANVARSGAIECHRKEATCLIHLG